MFDFFKFFKKRKGSEWAPLYLLIVVIIGAVVLLTLIKPALRSASESAISSGEEARAIAGLGIVMFRRFKEKR